jgi:hypothetical protein
VDVQFGKQHFIIIFLIATLAVLMAPKVLRIAASLPVVGQAVGVLASL